MYTTGRDIRATSHMPHLKFCKPGTYFPERLVKLDREEIQVGSENRGLRTYRTTAVVLEGKFGFYFFVHMKIVNQQIWIFFSLQDSSSWTWVISMRFHSRPPNALETASMTELILIFSLEHTIAAFFLTTHLAQMPRHPRRTMFQIFSNLFPVLVRGSQIFCISLAYSWRELNDNIPLVKTWPKSGSQICTSEMNLCCSFLCESLLRLLLPL